MILIPHPTHLSIPPPSGAHNFHPHLPITQAYLGSYSARSFIVPIAASPSEEKSVLTEATVAEVTNGNTVKVKIKGEEYSVHLIGMDAPERWERVSGWRTQNPIMRASAGLIIKVGWGWDGVMSST
jgi:endonuclease YncB( thermonuclease family)